MRRIVVLMAIGVAIRVATLTLPGTLDVRVWKIWAHAAATRPITSLYGVGGNPPARAVLSYQGEHTTVDYPPAMLYVLALPGNAVRIVSPEMPDTAAFTVAIKVPIVLADVALSFLMLLILRRRAGDTAATWAFGACVLNPAIVYDGAVLGYLDPLVALPACAAILAAGIGVPFVAGLLLGVAVMLKVQAVFVAPALFLMLLRDPSAVARAVVGAVLAVGVVLAPFLVAGTLPNVVEGLRALTRHDMLSANAANLWWLVTYVMRAVYAVADLGAWRAWTMPTRILAISTVEELGYPSPRPIGVVMMVAVVSWAFWHFCRGGGQILIFGTGTKNQDLTPTPTKSHIFVGAAMAAFTVHAYFVLAAQVHENHLYLAVPTLAIAAAGIAALRPVFYAVSGLVVLNLNLFYGMGRGVGFAIPRTVTVIDATVLLAGASVALLVWHAWIIVKISRPPAT